MDSITKFKSLLVFFLMVIPPGLIVSSCSSSTTTRKEALSDFKNVGSDIDDLRRWFVLADLRKSNTTTASFVLSADKLKAYVLFKESLINSLGVKGCDVDKKFYSCPRNSPYCTMCINLKNLSLNCGTNNDENYNSSGAVVVDNQRVMLKKINLVDENLSATKLIFSGMPAKYVFNSSSTSNVKKIDDVEYYKYSKDTDVDPEVVCRQNVDTVTCNATVTLASL